MFKFKERKMNKILVGLLASGVILGFCAQAVDVKMAKKVKHDHRARAQEEIKMSLYNSTPESVRLEVQFEDGSKMDQDLSPYERLSMEKSVGKLDNLVLYVKEAGEYKEIMSTKLHGGHKAYKLVVIKTASQNAPVKDYDIIIARY